MKKTILIIMSVAVLGALGMYINHNPAASHSLVSTTSNTPTNQTATAPSSSTSGQTGTTASSAYKDGTYNGSTDTAYGTVSIAIVISGGKITDVKYLQMPSDQGHSVEVTNYAEPLLKQTTLQKQSANIDFVSGATSTSNGFQQSLQAALDKAKIG